ncbi:MAG: site-specific integrase [Cyanobacteria bacterium J06597_1]
MSLPLATVATQFLDRPNLAKSTAESYEIALLPFLEKYGRIHINLLGTKLIYSYLKRQSHLSSSTLHRHKVILQSLFNYAIQQGYAETNPLGNTRRPKQYEPSERKTRDRSSAPTRRAVTPHQYELLYQAIGHDCRLQLLTRLSRSSGASIAQLLALNVADIDRENHQFPVQTKEGQTNWYSFSEEDTPCLNKYLRFYRHNSSEALFTAQHPVTKKVTRLSYRRVHQQWLLVTQKVFEIENIRLQDIRIKY